MNRRRPTPVTVDKHSPANVSMHGSGVRERKRYQPDVPLDAVDASLVSRTKEDSYIESAVHKKAPAGLPHLYPDPPPYTAGEETAAPARNRVRNRDEDHEKDARLYAEEAQLKLLHRMLLRNMPMDVCAQTLKVDRGEVGRLRARLMARLKAEAQKIDVAQHVGQALAFYDEVKATAMAMANNLQFDPKARVSALSVALHAQRDTIGFLKLTGLYQDNPMKWNPENQREVQRSTILQQMAEAFLTGEDIIETDVLDGSFVDEDAGMTLIGGV